MARSLNKLSARFVATVTQAGRYSDGGNLYLSVSSNGGHRWTFLYRWRGKPIELGLGSARVVPLARAREKAAEGRLMLSEGQNPRDARKPREAPPTFGAAADAYIAAMAPSWKNDKHVAGWRMMLTEYAKPLRGLPVDAIATEDVLAVLRPIWFGKPESASRVRQRIEAVLDAAKAHGHRQGDNPARWRGHLDKLLPATKKLSRGHHAAMPYSNVPAFVRRLRDACSTSSLALEFAILAAARSGEVMGCRWEEFSLVERLWTVPASRMKSGREHVVPLTDRMLEILRTVKGEASRDGSDYVFPGAKPHRPLSVMALAMALRRAGGGEFTVHGFRSSFRDWCGDQTAFPREIAEAALAHTIKDATERAYRRGNALVKRTELMEAWVRYINEGGANVIQLATARAG